VAYHHVQLTQNPGKLKKSHQQCDACTADHCCRINLSTSDQLVEGQLKQISGHSSVARPADPLSDLRRHCRFSTINTLNISYKTISDTILFDHVVRY
jgi:hypothetical protein